MGYYTKKTVTHCISCDNCGEELAAGRDSKKEAEQVAVKYSGGRRRRVKRLAGKMSLHWLCRTCDTDRDLTERQNETKNTEVAS